MKRTTEPLAEHTWLRIGGPAEIAIPESKSELTSLLKKCDEKNQKYRILGGGSNLLITDEGVDDLVIKITGACTNIRFTDGRLKVGASVMLPMFINSYIQYDLGGYEYLYSVPGTLGAAIYMNAGRGEGHGQTISDYLVSVEVYENGGVEEIDRNELTFKHRFSTFMDKENPVILSATFEMPTQPEEEGRKNAQARMESVNERERQLPNAGSVFKSGSWIPLHKLPPNGLSVGSARFTSPNRIVHDGDASYSEVRKLVERAIWLHQIVPPFRRPEIEWRIWDQ